MHHGLNLTEAMEWARIAQGMKNYAMTFEMNVVVRDLADGSIVIDVSNATQLERLQVVTMAYQFAFYYGKLVIETADTVGFVARQARSG